MKNTNKRERVDYHALSIEEILEIALPNEAMFFRAMRNECTYKIQKTERNKTHDEQ